MPWANVDKMLGDVKLKFFAFNRVLMVIRMFVKLILTQALAQMLTRILGDVNFNFNLLLFFF